MFRLPAPSQSSKTNGAKIPPKSPCMPPRKGVLSFFLFMKATIKTQGQQFAVSEGDILIVNRYPNTEAGSTVEITDVLSSGEGDSFKVGTPLLSGAKVTAKIL